LRRRVEWSVTAPPSPAPTADPPAMETALPITLMGSDADLDELVFAEP
jgi:hypothetical protein